MTALKPYAAGSGDAINSVRPSNCRQFPGHRTPIALTRSAWRTMSCDGAHLLLPLHEELGLNSGRQGATIQYLPMSTTSVKSKRPPGRGSRLDRQIARARAILRELRDTLEDLDDRRELARAKKRNAGKPGTDWETVKKEFGFEF